MRYHLGPPVGDGLIRQYPEDFRVAETLGFTPEGTGAHLWAEIRKTLLNTQDVVALLARELFIPARDIGISGQKDRNAVTIQWFSLPVGECAATLIDRVSALCHGHDSLELLGAVPHSSKLKRGTHRSNRFEIVVRDCTADRDEIELRVAAIAAQGFPNYFGPQRFGRNAKNLLTAERLFRGEIGRIDRTAKGMALSSSRSFLFNLVVSKRLSDSALDAVRLGDALQLSGSQSFFVHDGSDPEVVARIAAHDIHPTGPMWGSGDPVTGPGVARFESAVVENYPLLARGLERAGLKQQRRSIRVVPDGLTIDWLEKDTFRLGFSLPSGAFATSLLRELVNFE